MGSNEGKLTPVPANRLINLPQLNIPGDTLTTIRAYESRLTKETYVWAHSATKYHTIYRINQDLTTQIVYQGADLNLSSDPVHAVRGAYLFYIQKVKYLIWVDGTNWQGFLDVETSIATNSFHAPYFQLGEFEQEQYWQLPTRPPMHCMAGQWIDIAADNPVQIDMVNRMLDLTWQFRYKYIYTDGRDSEWSPISTMFYVERSENQKDAKGLPRCLSLRFPAGHPQVEKIVLAYRNCNGNAYDETNPFDFEEFKRINKYEDCIDPAIRFWERGIRKDEVDGSLIYDAATNDFVLVFCGEGTCVQIDVNETNRTENPCPITSYAMGVVENCLLLLNNVVGYDHVDCNLSDKFKVTLENPANTLCKVEYAEIKVAVIIHNIHRQVNQPIFTYGSSSVTDKKFFGGLMYRIFDTPFDHPGPYLQYFPDIQEGFIVYTEGSKNYAITKQWKDGAEYGPENDFNSGSKRRQVSRFLREGKTYVQYATVRVIKGTKGYLRLGGHRSKPSEGYADTSTTVIGILRNLSTYSARQNVIDNNRTDLYSREIYFDSCNGNVDVSNTPFVVADLSAPYTRAYAATAVIGYITDKNKNPVSRAEVDHTGVFNGFGSYDSRITDHNGFYFASWALMNMSIAAASLGIKIYIEGDGCTKVLGKQATVMQGGGAMPDVTVERDYKIEAIADYEKNNYAIVRLRVRDCRGAAMPGVPLVIKGYKAAITNISGIVSLVVRNRMFAYGQVWLERAVLMQSSSGYTNCNTNCNSCMPHWDINFPVCFSTEPVIDIKDATNNNLTVSLNPFFDIYKGLKPGGQYSFAPIFHDATGRHTWIPDDAQIVDFPTLQQMGAFGFSTIKWQIPGLLKLPKWVKYMSIARTANTAFKFMAQWVVDKVTFVDSVGKKTSSAAADKIRFSMQSLLDRNLQQLSSNVLYQWLDGDRLIIIANDAGDLFATGTGNMDFLIEGAITVKTEATTTTPETYSYELIISYDSRLKDLKEGTLIEINRPIVCDTEQPFFELCDTIDVADGEPVLKSGTLNTHDTYQLRRSITWNNIKHIFPFAFEHHSPSDFWGNRCDDRGRVFFKNIWARQIQEKQSGYLSDAILENGNRNGLSTFRSQRVKIFKSNTRGAITAAHSMDRMIKIICEHGNFIAAVGDGFIRTGRDGIARASNANEFLVETNQGSSQFGLQYEDPLACVFGDSWAMWVDTHLKALVFDDYNQPTDVTQGRIQGDFSSKLQFRENYNKGKTGTNRIRLVMGYDPVSKAAYLTFMAANFGDGFISNRQDVAIELNETYGVSILDQSIFMFGFTPEAYGCLHSSINGDVFFAFCNGMPWVHKEKNQTLFNQFFGLPVDQRMTLVLNSEPDIIKMFIAMQQQTLHKYFVDKVTCVGTDSRNGQIFMMESEIPPGCFVLRENKFSGSFLFNKLTTDVASGLWNGEALRGEFAEIYFVRDNSLNNSVTQKDNTKRVRYNELDNIFFIYTHSANSAYQTQ